MPHIVMLLSNAFRPHPRVLKEANSLVTAGYTVTVICWDRQVELPSEETLPGGVHILRIHSVPTVYGAGVKQLFRIPRFWSAAMHMAVELKPDIVHCNDLDTLYAGVQIKKKLNCKLIFDALEDYPALMSLYLPRLFVPLLEAFQRYLLGSVDAAIAASTVTADKLKAGGFSAVLHIPNVPELAPFEAITSEQDLQARRELGLSLDDYIVSYIGGFTRNRLILPLIEAMHNLPGARLLIWGDGHQRQAVEEAVKGMTNASYLGWLAADKVPLYTRMSNVIYYCLKPDYPGAIYNSPNTLCNAMAAGRPVIANDIGDLGRVVRKTRCGVLLAEATPQTIAEAINKLNDPTLRQQMGLAGRSAAREEYNWKVVEERLVNLYHDVLSKR